MSISRISLRLAIPVLFCAVGCATKPSVSTSPMLSANSVANTALDPAVDFTGTWKNQRNSTMKLVRAADGSITGEYTTLVGGPGGQPFTRKIVGQSNGDQITFYVDWSPYSMTAWVGQLLTDYDGKETLDTVWVNTVNIPEAEEPANGWQGVRNGGDRFTRR